MEGKGRLNGLIGALEAGRPAFCPGTIANGNYEDCMAAAESPYDFVIIDTEHADFDFPTLRHSMQYLLNRRRIAEAGSIAASPVPLVRIPPNANEMNQWVIKQTLDQGAYGIIVPHLGTVEEARFAVSAVRYPRRTDNEISGHGHRGWFPRHPARYWGLSVNEYFDAAELWPLSPQGELFLMPIIESVEGVKNLPQILRQVKGISAIWAGAGDLSVDMGHPGNGRHPEVEAGVQAILAACLENGVPCCTIAGPDDVEQRLEQGFRMIVAATPKVHTTLEKGRAFKK